MRSSTLCGIACRRAGRACIVMSAIGRPVPPTGGRRCSADAVLLQVPPRVGAKSRSGSARISVARAPCCRERTHAAWFATPANCIMGSWMIEPPLLACV